MAELIDLLERRIHAADSTGYRSGRSSDRETPVARSMGSTNSAATPLLDRDSQYQTCDCVVPIRSASGFCPPATSIALLSPAFDMDPSYPFFGDAQPKNTCKTANRIFGNSRPMRGGDSKAFGERVLARRIDLGMSQEQLASATGYSQSNIGWIEQGKPKRPEKHAYPLARPLQTTPEWLLYGQGPKHVGPVYIPTQTFSEKYDGLPPELKAEVSHALEKAMKSATKKRA